MDLALRPFEVRILDAYLETHGTSAQVADVVGVSRNTVNKVLSGIAHQYGGMAREQMYYELKAGTITFHREWWQTNRVPKHPAEHRAKRAEIMRRYRARQRELVAA